MSTLTIDLKLGSNAGFSVPDRMMGYWLKGIPEYMTQPTEAEVLQAAGDLFTAITVEEHYQTGKRNITLIALPRYKPDRPSPEAKQQFLENLATIMYARST